MLDFFLARIRKEQSVPAATGNGDRAESALGHAAGKDRGSGDADNGGGRRAGRSACPGTDRRSDGAQPGAAGEFQDKLHSQLVSALKAGGPLLALDVGQKAAPAIAQEVGAGATIWRTSLKARHAASVTAPNPPPRSR